MSEVPLWRKQGLERASFRLAEADSPPCKNRSSIFKGEWSYLSVLVVALEMHSKEVARGRRFGWDEEPAVSTARAAPASRVPGGGGAEPALAFVRWGLGFKA